MSVREAARTQGVRGLTGGLRGGAALAAAIGAMNLATYAYTMVAARWLGPSDYGAFAALMGLLLVLGVVQLGLQATGARRIAAAPREAAEVERSVLGVSHRSAVVLGLLCLVLAPLIDRVLRLDSLSAAVLVAAAAVPMTVVGGQAGVLQGERRWLALSLVYLANGVPRLAIGTALVVWQPSVPAAMVGVLVGQCAPVLVGWLALRHCRQSRPAPSEPRAAAPPASEPHTGGAVLLETVHSSHALLAFFALSNADVLVARGVLDDQGAGLYAAGLIVVKAVLFLPQFVVVLAFPSMTGSDSGAARRRVLLGGLAAVAGVGLACALGAQVLSGVALTFVGGQEYGPVEGVLWRFAILGTLLSMLQLLVYGVLARRSRRSVVLLWLALALVVGLGRLAGSWTGLLDLVTAVDGGLFVVLLGVSLWRLRALGASAPPRASSGRSRPRRPVAR